MKKKDSMQDAKNSKFLSIEELEKKPSTFLLNEIDRLTVDPTLKPDEVKRLGKEEKDYLFVLRLTTAQRLGLWNTDFENKQRFEKLEGRLNNHRHQLKEGSYSSKPEY